MQVSCKGKHALMWSIEQNYNTPSFRCDRCGKIGSCISGRLHCPICKFDLCSQCSPVSVSVTPTVSTRPAPPAPQVNNFCAKNHPLSWSTNFDKYPGGRFSCDRCKNSYPCNVGRWFCSACSYDVCGNCLPINQYPPEPIQTGPVPVRTLPGVLQPGQVIGGQVIPEQPHAYTGQAPGWQPPPMCAKSHPLQWNTDAIGYPGGIYSCDQCKTTANCQGGRWCCKQCQYDLCPNCKAKTSGSTGMSYPTITSSSQFVATDPSQAGGPATPTVCMGGQDPNGTGFNDYYILCFDILKQNLPVNITLIDIWTDYEQSGITYIWIQYQVINAQGQIEIYDLEHGVRPISESMPHMTLTLNNMEHITNIKGKYADEKITQLTIESSKGPVVIGSNEGIDFDLRVPKGRKVVAIATQFTTHMKCIGAYFV